MPTGHEAYSAGLTGHSRGVEPGEPRTVFGETVDMGRFRIGMAVATEVAVAKVISEDENDVGLILARCGLCRLNGQASQDDNSCRCEKGFLSFDVHLAPIPITGASGKRWPSVCSLLKTRRTEERSDAVPASVIHGEFQIAGSGASFDPAYLISEVPTLLFLVASSGRRDFNPIDLHELLLDGWKETDVDQATLDGKRHGQFLPVATAHTERRALASRWKGRLPFGSPLNATGPLGVCSDANFDFDGATGPDFGIGE